MTTKRLAFHEAGHAVIALALGIKVHRATIRCDDGITPGRVDHDDCYPDSRYPTVEDENHTKVALAGPIAEMKFDPTLDGEWFANQNFRWNDISNVAIYLELAAGPLNERPVPGKPLQQDDCEAAILWDSLQKDTLALVELHWPSIERVAEALLIRGELGPEEIEALF